MFQDIEKLFERSKIANIVIGVELEFYFENIEEKNEIFIISQINYALKKIESCSMSIVKEKSDFQYELQISPHKDNCLLMINLNLAKELIIDLGHSFGAKAIFSSKPYLDRSGNGFHVHINFLDKECKNLFYVLRGELSDYLKYSIGGMCYLMKRHMIYFAPYSSSYLRYKYHDMNTPTTISWGNNNRTTAIRLINYQDNINSCRIEHRVSGSDCNYNDVIVKIIESMIFGISNMILPPKQIYGVAGDLQYNLNRLPTSIEKAELCNKNY